MESKKNHSQTYNSIKREMLPILPFLFIAAIVPFVLRLAIIPVPEEIFRYTPWETNTDLFSYYKAIVYFLAVLAAVVVYFFDDHTYKNFRATRISNSNHQKIYYIPIAVIAFFTLTSAFFSDFRHSAFFGFPDRYEGLFIWLAYLMTAFLAAKMMVSEQRVKWVSTALLVSAALLGVLGIFQYLGYDILRTDLAKHLMVPFRFAELRDEVDFRFGAYTIYATMYNTNYVGSYFAMLLPLSTVLFFHTSSHKSKVLAGLFAGLMFANWLGCRSRAGWMGGIAAFVILAILLRKQILKQYKAFALLLTFFLVIAFGMNAVSGGSLRGKMTIEGVAEEAALEEETIGDLQDMQTHEDGLYLAWQDTDLNIRIDDQGVPNMELKGQPIETKQEEEHQMDRVIYRPEDEWTNHVQVVFDRETSVFLIGEEDEWEFPFVMTTHGFMVVGPNNRLFSLETAPSIGFEGRERLGSGRGYIFSRTFPLLKDTLFLGNGPDTFAMAFPQDDLLGKLKHMRVTTIVDKPHNLYLQLGVNHGIPAMLAFIFLIAAYSIKSIKQYIHQKSTELDFTHAAGIGCLLAVIGYSVAGLFNDSVISVAPVFWLLLGMGIGVNALNEKKEI